MYTLNESKTTDEQGILFDTYGISYEGNEILDVSTDKSQVEKLIKLCNELELSPVHINDVLEDFLTNHNI